MERNGFGNFGHPRNISVKLTYDLKTGHWPRRCRLKVFPLLALVVILFSGAERFEQFW